MSSDIQMSNLLPHSILKPHIAVFDLLMKKRLADLELDKLLIYLIDTVGEKALILLAEQFDVMGYKGWKLADTEEKRRELLKKAIELHRFKGTVWAVKEALRTIGYPDAMITEHVTHWAGFTIQLGAGVQTINTDQIAEAVQMINEYKNVRSHLMGIQFKVDFSDTLTITDTSYESAGDLYEDSIFTSAGLIYDGTGDYDGEYDHSPDGDVLELTIIDNS